MEWRRQLARRLPDPMQKRLRGMRMRTRRASFELRDALGLVRSEVSIPPLVDAQTRLVIGPANFAGQAWQWARAVERVCDSTSAQVVAVEREMSFPADVLVDVPTYRSPAWGAAMERHVLGQATHVMIEALRPLFGIRNGDDCAGDLRVLQRHRVATALVTHGSDIRLPSLHAELYPYSPFSDTSWEMTERLERQAQRFLAVVRGFPGPKFVSTPDQLDFVADATWLPTVVDVDRWAVDRPALQTRRPVVLHAPSNARLKGSEHVEPVARKLADEGLIHYVRIDGVRHDRMPDLVAQADIVVEQLVLGLYSVAAVEAMAAGRLVLAHVHDRVRRRLPCPLPVVEATPATLEEVLRAIVSDPDVYMSTARAGVDYSRRVHDGQRSAAVMGGWLTGEAR